MNLERMNELAEMLERQDVIQKALWFNMADFIGVEWRGIPLANVRKAVEQGACNTTCCIGGWACWLWGEDDDWFQASTAQRLLGLSDEQKNRLFFDEEHYVSRGQMDFDEIDHLTAAKAIRRMVEEDENLRLYRALTEGIQVVFLEDPEALHKAIADAVGETEVAE